MLFHGDYILKCISNIVKETSTIFRQTREGNVVFGADVDDEAEALAVFCFCKGFDITQVDASIYFVFIADCLLLQVVDAKICDHQRPVNVDAVPVLLFGHAREHDLLLLFGIELPHDVRILRALGVIYELFFWYWNLLLLIDGH